MNAHAHAPVHALDQRVLQEGRDHSRMVAHYATWYVSVRQHKTLRVDPKVAAGLSKTLWSMEDVLALIDAEGEPAEKRGPCAPCASKAA